MKDVKEKSEEEETKEEVEMNSEAGEGENENSKSAQLTFAFQCAFSRMQKLNKFWNMRRFLLNVADCVIGRRLPRWWRGIQIREEQVGAGRND